MNLLPDIRTLSLAQIQDFITKSGEKQYRANQIFAWLWKHPLSNFDDMKNLSVKLRELLKTNFSLFTLKQCNLQKSKDKTTKYAFELFDGEIIESVLIPSKERTTACISTQVGCALKCRFCATGTLKFKRNLTVGEIYDQVLLLNQESFNNFGHPLTNIVIMGMGEPLLNYDNTLSAINKLISEDGLRLSPQRITLSTVGIPEMIKKLANDKIRFNLAVSLHTANILKRNNLIPANKAYPLPELIEAIKFFNQKTGSRITFEYLLLKGFNDTLKDAKELAEFCKNFPVKINLIEYNNTESSEFNKSTPESLQTFKEFLESKNIIVNVRVSKGEDIDAACGQLANKYQKK